MATMGGAILGESQAPQIRSQSRLSPLRSASARPRAHACARPAGRFRRETVNASDLAML